MYDMFENLDPAKKERVLNAALKEFSHRGYDDASTNSIVAVAGISKGILFRYFGSKKNLYLYLYEYVREVMDKEIYNMIDTGEGDLPQILMQLGMRKMVALKRYPDMTEFISQVKREKSPEVSNELSEIEKKRSYQLIERNIFKNSDLSQLKPEFRNEKTINLIRWALEGYAKELRDQYTGLNIRDADIDEAMSEYNRYVEIIKKAFYR